MIKENSLLEVLDRLAAEAPDRVACRFLSFGPTPTRELSYAALGRHARAVGAAILDHAKRGDRVILLYPPDLEFVTAFLGSFYAGAVAVPMYPPDPSRPGRDLTKLRAVVADATPTLILTTKSIRNLVLPHLADAPDLSSLRWLETDAVDRERDCGSVRLASEDLAFLQYTSGSTGLPKGVMVSHGNLLNNVRCIKDVFEDDASSALVSWLPLYHDMGLIGNLLHGLFVGTTATLMSPLDFLEKPIRWLEAISQTRAHTSGGPNFAYELCVRRIAPDQRASLDLSSWRVAFNGAEPVRSSTIERFVAAFEPHGFRREAFLPCYGLAEATLIVSGTAKALPPTVAELEVRALETDVVEYVAAGATAPGRSFVGCGAIVPDHEVAIVNPATLAKSPSNQIGEIWVKGPSVAQGYWGKPGPTVETFGARISASEEGPYLRTGDLGFLRGGDLFITGRLKDLVIVRGRNHYPQDIELTAERAHPALRPGCGAAFTVEVEESERLVLVFEIDPAHRETSAADIGTAVAQSVSEFHDLDLHELVLIETRRIPKTTSGKIQRRQCRTGYLASKLPKVSGWVRQGIVAGGASATAIAPSDTDTQDSVPSWAAAAPADRPIIVERWLRERLAKILAVPASALTNGISLVRLGVDSLRAVELRGAIEIATGVVLSFAEILQSRDLAALAALLSSRAGDAALPAKGRETHLPIAPTEDGLPSFGQKRLWFLAELEPESSAYNECLTLRIDGPLGDTGAIERAIQASVRRHEALRMSFYPKDGEPSVAVASDLQVVLEVEDLRTLPEAARLRAAMQRIDLLAAKPFSLSVPPLFRTTLFRLDETRSLLAVVIHHIVCDARSSQILCDELAQSLGQELGGARSTLAPVALGLSQLSARERAHLKGATLTELRSYWSSALAAMPTSVPLPTDHPTPLARTNRAGTVHFELSPALTKGLRELAQREEVTLFSSLLAGFFAFLERYSGQDDIPVGVPVDVRETAEATALIGFFVNTLVLRGDLSGDPSFRDLLSRVSAVALGALTHRAMPLELLVEGQRPDRVSRRSPLFNTMFSFEAAPLAPFAVGPYAFTPVPQDRATTQFDLTLTLTDATATMKGSFEYDAELFDRETIERMACHFETLLCAAVKRPELRISELPLEEMATAPRLGAREGEVWRSVASVPEQFLAQVRRSPEAVAVVEAGRAVSYRELDARAEQLGLALREQGVGPEVIVGVCMERSIDLVVTLLGVWKAGGAYLPLDPSYPDERLEFMLEDAGVKVVVSDENLVGRMWPGRVVLTPKHRAMDPVGELGEVKPEQLAYVIYTSGSSGAPKGVEVEHCAIGRYIATVQEEFALKATDRILQFTAPTFDVAGEEIWGALTSGATLVLRTAELHTSMDTFLTACEEWKLTVLDLPTAFFGYVVGHLSSQGLGLPKSVRLVVVGGEALPVETLRAWQGLPERPMLINAYGPTEATVSATFWKLGGSESVSADRVPIGGPLPGVFAYVLDGYGRAIPRGLAGELCVGGVGLARGYLRRPELTRERFIENPFGAGRLYRTGDQVRVLSDGNLVFLGRTDQQVKVRGYRIELGDIEHALSSHAAVSDAVVLCAGGERDATLVGYIVPRAGATVDPSELRRYLKGRLPEPMVPSRVVVLERWPLTSHGKVDRRALALLPVEESSKDETEQTRTPFEEMTAACFRDVLECENVGPLSDFFALGGHSLLATRLVSRVRGVIQKEVPLRLLFEAPTVRGFAAAIETIVREGQALRSPPRRGAAAEGTTVPMSFAQQRLWFLARLEPGSTLYNMSGAFRISGPLDVVALENAFTALVTRQSVLRTRLTLAGGVPVQVTAPPARHSLVHIDLEGRAAEADAVVNRESAAPFDLETGPLLRTSLVRIGAAEHILVVSMHHAVSDGWSVSVLFDDLAALYEAEITRQDPALLPLAVEYGDYAVWQREAVAGELLATQLAYWRTRLGGSLPVLQLPVARRRPPVQTFRGASVEFEVSSALARRLRSVSQSHGNTLFMTLMAAFQVLLSRYSGQEDILVGTPSAGRGHAELEPLIGLFLNTLVIRTSLEGAPSFLDVLARVRQATIEAWTHQDVPFDKLVEDLNPERSMSHSPIFQAMFVLQNTPPAVARLHGVSVVPLSQRDESAKFDLTLSMEEQGETIVGSLQHNVDLFDAETARRITEHFLVLLDAATKDPEKPISELPLMTAADVRALEEINATRADYPEDKCLHELFEAQVALQPRALALVSGTTRLSYADLATRSRQLARRLRREGAKPNGAIAIVMSRGWEQIVAMLAIHGAGSAYLPIDASIPNERLCYILDNAGVDLVVTQEAVDSRTNWPERVRRIIVTDPALAAEEASPLPRAQTPDDLAYILYTSGSTGRPKGVTLKHRGAVNTVWDINARFGLGPTDRAMGMSATTFDLSVYDVFGTLGAGAALVIPDADKMRDPSHWATLVAAERVSIWSSVPAYVQMLLAQATAGHSSQLGSLRVVALSGDTFPVGLATQIREALGPITVVNLGGNTEASIWSVVYPIDAPEPAWSSVPYGHPLHNQRCYVLNDALVHCPPGVPGDLYFAGLGLAREYLGDEEKTNAAFRTLRDTGERVYRTGDLAFWGADGELILLGRSDFQVKVQGFRIEPGEVEHALKAYPRILDAVVVARADHGQSEAQAPKRLVAHVVATDALPLSAAELRAFLAERLPDYMIPSVFVQTSELPRSANGKVDRNALRAQSPTTALSVADALPPRTPLEHAVAAIWCEVLGLQSIGVHANFFELGGHSLLATQLVARLLALLGIELTLRTVFESPTVAEMAIVVAEELAARTEGAHLASLVGELEQLTDQEAEFQLTNAVEGGGAAE